jgi:anti-sigma factor RsiW
MTSETRHFKDEVHEMVDDRLPAELRDEVSAHVAVCADCRRELEVARWVKDVARRDLKHEELPRELERAVASKLDGEATGSMSSMRWITVAAGIAITVASIGLVWRHLAREEPIPAEIASDFLRFREQALELQMTSSSEAEVERFFEERGIAFPTRVFDFRMMDFEVLGGRIHRVGGRPSALFAYRGSGAKLLLCQMYEGSIEELPGPREERENDDIRFHVYRVGRVTVVFWQEGDVACALASDAPVEEVVALAFAKAIKV